VHHEGWMRLRRRGLDRAAEDSAHGPLRYTRAPEPTSLAASDYSLVKEQTNQPNTIHTPPNRLRFDAVSTAELPEQGPRRGGEY
jgi:hypothetical protein